MSFLDNYLDKYRLSNISEKVKKNLDKLEGELAKKIDANPTDAKFEDEVKKFGPQIADIVSKFAEHFKNKPGWSVSTAFGSFKFVLNIGVEVFQIVEGMKSAIVTDDMPEEEQHAAKVDFGKDLIFFIWMSVDPLAGRLSWIPFKKTIEKKLVYWVAGMALDFTVDLFAANAGVETFSVKGENTTRIRGF